MNTGIYNTLFSNGHKVLALLIDPGKLTEGYLEKTVGLASNVGVDIILVGGSLTSVPIDGTIDIIKRISPLPVVLFPGNLLQLSSRADGILLLSLISGRNPEYLIGNHVLASQYIRKSGLEVIPAGYILVNGHNQSSVEYISNTLPIPAEKSDIVVATALAGEQLGLKLIYLEAGSGASNHVKEETVRQVKENITIPLIVGGGIRTPDNVRRLFKAGANGVVVGSVIEDDYKVLSALTAIKEEFQ